MLHDILGLYEEFVPKHTRRYANLAETISAAFARYMSDVKDGTFPGDVETFHMDEAARSQLRDLLEDLDHGPQDG